ncbi:MAG: peroxidase [Acidobacteria bacterium]|nr:peroxidase [Acidobacteriota bacterium]
MAPLSNDDFKDMQGLLRFGYGKLTQACFLLLRIDESASASRWLGQAPVTTAETQNPPPSRALQIAITAQGLKKLRVPEEVINAFSPEFISGMTGEDNRSRRLGDVGANSPDQWLWGQQSSVPDIVVLLYEQSSLHEWKNTIESQVESSGFALLRTLVTTNMGGVEPFGFVDGVSNPAVDWERRRDSSGDKLSYGNLSMLGEFVLGYPNEYGRYTTRPILENSTADLPNAEDAPAKKDLGRNGTYLVMRQLDQDVHGFWQFLNEQTGGDSDHAQKLAELFVGRRMSGESLPPQSNEPIEGVGPAADDIRRNQFTFDSDPQGVLCPFGSHIRRANPRNIDLPSDTPRGALGRLSRILALNRVLSKDPAPLHFDRVASTRFHRLIRRGREYGPPLTQDQRKAAPIPNEPASGLHFICLNANIGRQFEFIQGSWLQSTTFDGLRDEDDPLVGIRQTAAGCPASRFSLPTDAGLRQQIHNIPRFVTVRGGAYFFLPGIRALRYIARVGTSS